MMNALTDEAGCSRIWVVGSDDVEAVEISWDSECICNVLFIFENLASRCSVSGRETPL